MIREPAVAGRFYPNRREDLTRLLDQYLAEPAPHAAYGVMVPHAGYVYSGAVAGATFARTTIPPTVVILGPNHHGLGFAAALSTSRSWLTPLGEVAVATELGLRLLKAIPQLKGDESAHRFEHSLEVQVPFLQRLQPALRIVPLCIGQLPLAELLEIGVALGRFFAAEGERPLLVASSDMTHYEPGAVARVKDERALERVLALDPAGLYHTVRDGGITMCGVLPTVIMLAAAKELGATRAELVRYANSGDITGDQSEVVGYAGVVVS